MSFKYFLELHFVAKTYAFLKFPSMHEKSGLWICVRVCVRERGRESVSVRVWERDSVSMCVRDREFVCVCV